MKWILWKNHTEFGVIKHTDERERLLRIHLLHEDITEVLVADWSIEEREDHISESPTTFQEIEKEMVKSALSENSFIKREAASTLGITPRMMTTRIQRYELQPWIDKCKKMRKNKLEMSVT